VRGLTIRHYRPADLGALAALINEADAVDDAGFATSAEALAHLLADPLIGGGKNVFVAEAEGHLVGYVRMTSLSFTGFDVVVNHGIVHPQQRRQGIGTALMARAEEQARLRKGAKTLYLDLPARSRVSGASELAQSLGMAPVRYFVYMECHSLVNLPEPVFPDGIGVRDYAVGKDEPIFVAAVNDGFSDHWGSVAQTLEVEVHRVSSPDFRAEANLLAVDRQGQVVGLCTLVFRPSGPPVVEQLAVIHGYRRRGIGRALLLAGMRRIRELGGTAAALAVDADNPNQALGLYESAGFAAKSQTTIYRKEL